MHKMSYGLLDGNLGVFGPKQRHEEAMILKLLYRRDIFSFSPEL